MRGSGIVGGLGCAAAVLALPSRLPRRQLCCWAPALTWAWCRRMPAPVSSRRLEQHSTLPQASPLRPMCSRCCLQVQGRRPGCPLLLQAGSGCAGGRRRCRCRRDGRGRRRARAAAVWRLPRGQRAGQGAAAAGVCAGVAGAARPGVGGVGGEGWAALVGREAVAGGAPQKHAGRRRRLGCPQRSPGHTPPAPVPAVVDAWQDAGRRVSFYTLGHVLGLDLGFHLDRRTGAGPAAGTARRARAGALAAAAPLHSLALRRSGASAARARSSDPRPCRPAARRRRAVAHAGARGAQHRHDLPGYRVHLCAHRAGAGG